MSSEPAPDAGRTATGQVPPPPRPPRARLRRPRQGRLIAGVGAGLAGHLGVDVVLVRVVLVVLAFLTNGLLVLAYLVAIPFIPVGEPDRMARAGGESGSVQQPWSPGTGGDTPPRGGLFWLGIGALVLGVALLLGIGGGFISVLLGSTVLFPLVLIAFGIALWRASDRPASSASTTTGWDPSASWSSPQEQPMPASSTWAGSAGVAPSPQSPPAGATGGPPAAPSSVSPAAPSSTTVAATTGAPAAATSASPNSPPLAAGLAGDGSASAPDGSSGWGGDGGPVGPGGPTGPTGPGGPGGAGPTIDGDGWQPPPVPVRARSLLGRITIGVAFITLGILWALHLAGLLTVSPGQALASALVVIGLGTLVGSVVGRSPSLLVIGVLLVPLVLLATLARPFGVDVWWTDADVPVGDQRIAPATWDDVEDRYELGAGRLQLLLQDLEVDGVDRALTVSAGAGEVIVRVPEELGLQVRARSGIGEIGFPGLSRTAGLGQQRDFDREPAPGAGTLTIDVEVGVGSIIVRDGTGQFSIFDDRGSMEPAPEPADPPAPEPPPASEPPANPEPPPAPEPPATEDPSAAALLTRGVPTPVG
ncbi:MAG: PspC domain-containing protein [Nitriliruptoraceae bacterium]|nr:PspC domain-containing protein [Nitriliruptoraceae bacterium]